MGRKQGPRDSANLMVLLKLNQLLLSQQLDKHNCNPADFGTGWGKHTLCGKQAPNKPCYFYSFGETTVAPACNCATTLSRQPAHHTYLLAMQHDS